MKIEVHFLAAVLALVLAVPGCAQDQKAQAPPGANAPQTQPPNPPNDAPGNDRQATAPSENSEIQAAPTEPSTPKENSPAPRPEAPTQQPPQSKVREAKPKSSSHNAAENRRHKKPAPTHSKASSGHPPNSTAPGSSGEPGKVVVRNGGTNDDVVHLAPGGTQEQELHNRENTTQLLATTDENLKRLAGRQLSPAEQGTVDQIHAYMRQAKSAADAGDLSRAHTLAFKAHLLSDDLAKR